MRDTRPTVPFLGMGLSCLAGALIVVFPLAGMGLGAAAAAILLVRRPTFVVAAYIGAAVFADYISSWLPLVGGFPAGAIVRDTLALTILLASALALARRSDRPPEVSPTIERAAIQGSQLPLLALWLLTCVLVLGAPSLVAGILGARNILLYPTVAVGCWVLVEQGRVRASTIRHSLVFTLSLAAVMGMLDAATGGHILNLFGYNPYYAGAGDAPVAGAGAAVMGVGRASGGVSNALTYGYLMATLSVFAIYGALNLDGSSRRRVRTSGYLLLATIAAIVCALTLTRGAIVALVLGVLFLIIRSRSTRLTSSALLVAIVVGFVMVAVGPADVVVSRLLSQDVSSQVSTETRLSQLAMGIDRLAQHPLGVGLGSEGSGAIRGGSGSTVTDFYPLVVALQVGIPGLLAFLLLLASWMVAALRSRRREGALLSALIAMFVVAAVLSATPDAPVYAVPFWLLLVFGGARNVVPPNIAPSRADRFEYHGHDATSTLTAGFPVNAP